MRPLITIDIIFKGGQLSKWVFTSVFLFNYLINEPYGFNELTLPATLDVEGHQVHAVDVAVEEMVGNVVGERRVEPLNALAATSKS